MFIGRKRELQSLQNVYDKKGFGMTVVYGRRRIGKSTLIAEFIKNRKSIFYTATKIGAERNLELFSEQVISVLDPDVSGVTFKSLEAVFDYITGRLTDEKLVLVIDELPYWAESDSGLLSVIQKYIDTKWLNSELMIILCGSSLSFMENKVLSEKSPVFGRRDSQIRLEAFGYKETALFVPEYSAEEKAIVYGVTGGVAKYLSVIEPKRSLDENIINLFFSSDGYLYDEPRNLLTHEFTDISIVNNIIEQIASGANTVNLISGKIHEKESAVLYYLEKLLSTGLVEKKFCITEEKNRKKTRYVLKDHMFKFWYEFVPGAHSVIAIGRGDLYYEKAVKPHLHEFMGSVFEEMCRSYVLENGVLGEFGSFITSVGMWWGNEKVTGQNGNSEYRTADIDVVGISETDKSAVVGECKFKTEKTDRNVYETLIRRSALLSGKYRIDKYLFFSLNGFTEWFDTIDSDNVVLISLEDMYC